MTDSDKIKPKVTERLELLRNNGGFTIAEMARMSGLHKRSMENYFRGHKPSYDALIAMAKGFKVPVDWLCGFESPTGEHVEKIVHEAAFENIYSLLRSIRMYQRDGVTVFSNGNVFGIPLEEYAEEQSQEVVRRFASIRRFYPTPDAEEADKG